VLTKATVVLETKRAQHESFLNREQHPFLKYLTLTKPDKRCQ
jgi:hypothetical protein